jgi:hypothetical protein
MLDVTVILPIPRDLDESRDEIERISAELRRLRRSFEVLVVVTRDAEGIADWRPSAPEVLVIEVGSDIGESTALALGFERARGAMVVTLTRYPQVEMAALAPALEAIEEDRADLVVSRRHPRHGSWANRLQSRVYHRLVWWLTGSGYQDLGCGFRVMKGSVARELDLYGSLDRFVPLLAHNLGLRVLELEVAQFRGDRPHRLHGVRAIATGFLDALTILFLTKFTRRPLRFFGPIGMALGAAGGAILAYLLAYRLFGYGGIADRPLLLLGVLLTVLGVQSVSIGLLGEIIIFTHARRLRSYRVLREISFSRAQQPACGPGAPDLAGSEPDELSAS